MKSSVVSSNVEYPLSRKEAARYLWEKWHLQISFHTLATYAARGGGPIYELFGGRTGYLPSDLDAWARSKRSGRLVTASQPEIAV